MQAGWGTSSSPVVHDDLVFLQVDNEEKSFVVAYDTKTGDERWRDSRKERSNWSSPIIWKNAEQTELIAGGRTVRSYDPASGKVLWELAMGGGRSSASPVADENRLYVGTEKRNRGGYDDGGGTLFAVKVGATGDVTPSEGESTSEGVVWSRPNVGLSMASPLVYENFVYVLGRRSGMVSCYAAETGEPAFENKRLPGARAFWASPWAYGGKVFCLDDTGTTHVIEPGAELSVVAKNTIGDQFWASSAIAGGSLLLRGVDSLYCIKQ
jgi:outer membrane protein assembly factor BamB